MKIITLTITLLGLSIICRAQILAPVHWSYAAKKLNSKEAVLFIKATIDEGWHIYSVNQKEGGPIKTEIKFTPAPSYELNGQLTEPQPVTKFEKTFNMEVSYFEKSVVFQQKIKLKGAKTTVKGQVSFMTCNDEKCLPPDELAFSIPVK